MAVTHHEKAFGMDLASIGPMTEAGAGLAVMVLAILGLAGVAPAYLAAIATIIVGAALLLQISNTAAEYSWAFGKTGGAMVSAAELGGGMTVGFMAGGVGIVLGILALLGIATAVLLPAALIVFGSTLLLSAGVTAQVSWHRIGMSEADTAVQAMAREAATAASGAQALLGLATLVLGILALTLPGGGALVLVGLLAVGASLLLTSAAVAGAALSIVRP
jgi:hypothetical protein